MYKLTEMPEPELRRKLQLKLDELASMKAEDLTTLELDFIRTFANPAKILPFRGKEWRCNE